METCLHYFAFVIHLKQLTNFTYSEMISAFADAKKMIGKKDEDEKNIVEDIIDITNLITRDGYDNYTFVHKSIQDFYAAKFISSSSEENQHSFWRESEESTHDVNFCYMMMCLSPSVYYGTFIKPKYNIIDCLELPILNDSLNYLMQFRLLFGCNRSNGSFRYDLRGVTSVAKKKNKKEINNNEFPFDLVSMLDSYLFINTGYCSPLKPLFSFCEAKIHMEKYRIAILKKH